MRDRGAKPWMACLAQLRSRPPLHRDMIRGRFVLVGAQSRELYQVGRLMLLLDRRMSAGNRSI